MENKARADIGIPHKCIARGDYADVWLFGEALEEYEALTKRTDRTSIQEAAQMARRFERFASHGPRGLSDEMFKALDPRIKVKGNEILIQEFKAYQFRIYGVVGQRNGKRSYLGTACDPQKKKNKADPQKMKKAAEAYLEVKNG